MVDKVKIGEFEYNVAEMNDIAKAALNSYQFSNQRIEDLTRVQAMLQKAKNSYAEDLKKEMLSEKSGFLFGDD